MRLDYLKSVFSEQEESKSLNLFRWILVIQGLGISVPFALSVQQGGAGEDDEGVEMVVGYEELGKSIIRDMEKIVN